MTTLGQIREILVDAVPRELECVMNYNIRQKTEEG